MAEDEQVRPQEYWRAGPSTWRSDSQPAIIQDPNPYTIPNTSWPSDSDTGVHQAVYTERDETQVNQNGSGPQETPNELPHQIQSRQDGLFEPVPREGAYVGRSNYISQETPIDEARARAYASRDEAPLSETQLKTLDLWGSIDLPPRAVRKSLIDTYILRCYPWTPIPDPEYLETLDERRPSQLLMQSLFLAASRVSSAPGIKAYASSEQFYQRAKALFWCGHEKNPLTVIAATIMLHWYNGDGPEHVSFDTSRFWSHISTGLAHQVGLHKEPARGVDAPFRRRLWWSLVARDSLISAGQGRPRAINLKDSDVRPPCMDDFPGAEHEGELFIPYVEICILLGDLTECCSRKHFSRSQRLYLETALYRWSRRLPISLLLSRTDDMGRTITYPYNVNARQLHVPYFITVAIMARSTAAEGTAAVAVLASSFVIGIFEDFLARDEIQFLGPICTFHLLAAGVALASTRLHPNLWAIAQQELEVLQSSLKELSNRWPSAIGAMKALQNVLDRTPRLQQGKPHKLEWLTADQELLFENFSRDLCRMWAPYQSLAKNGNTELMTAEILGNLRYPLPGGPDQAPTPLMTFPEATDLQYDGVGNWLFDDWAVDMSW